ncbi:Putative transposase, YhgA-like [Serratia fonticola]|uniref:Rpn family recombination-promoting nuclease/putative transposase n=1 Tax=Serratia fonticola TaxID=47917 RepID=UPI002182A745|nr:Rpn family recombination-promoting nuclease/putative transposase [Serratia fonticola]CAI2058415.1 Putative transposase, YhgA-like [Serratia fonticola]
MKKATSTPHDAVFKQFLTHPDTARDFLELHVPPALLQYCDLNTLNYPYSMSWVEEFSEPELARQFYAGHFPLVDVTVIPDDEIMQHRRMAILELLQKHVRQRDLVELLEQLVTLLLAGYTTKEQLISLVNYMLLVGKATEPETLLRELARRAPRHEEDLMTIAEYLEQKGFEKGIKQGIKQGMEKGRETVLEIASSMLAEGFERAMVMKLTGLSENDLAQIHHSH